MGSPGTSRWTNKDDAGMALHTGEASSSRGVNFPGGMFARTLRGKRIAELLPKQARGLLLLEAVAMVGLVGFVDYITGYEVTVFPFYSFAILFALWFDSTASAMAIAVMSALTWWGVDTALRHPYSREWLQVWDATVRFIFFLLVIASGSAIRKQRDANRAQIALLERSQKLEREIIGISEREQQRIGRDLHDGLGQYMVAIGMAADSLKDDLEKESLRGAPEMKRISDYLHNAVVRIRDISRGLSPVDRDEGGLEAALEELATSASRLANIPVTFICEGFLPVNNNERAVHLFRIAQEALGNAIKHGRPKLIVIALETDGNGISLRVSDDGTGIDPVLSKTSRGMGFNIMHYRARMAGGTLDIQPNSPTGTVVTCSIPDISSTPSNPDSISHE